MALMDIEMPHMNGRVWGEKRGEQFPFDPGVHPLYLTYEGTDAGAFVSFTIA